MSNPESDPVFILAADHRDTLRTMFGLGAVLDEAELARIADIKNLILDALVAAAPSLNGSTPGILIDERFGTDAALRAQKLGIALAMPVEKSLRSVFEFEFDDAWAEHIETFSPDYVKSLVLYNPEGPKDDNRVQIERLQTLCEWLEAKGHTHMLEILVPGTDAQLEKFGTSDRYDAELRPELVSAVIEEMHAAGIRPEVWKIEGTSTTADAAAIVETARSGGKKDVKCLILGRGEDDSKVEHWISCAAPVDGFGGFAIGRTIWAPAVHRYLDGETDRNGAVEMIRDKYLHLVGVYQDAR